ncbi:glycoside hydrolase family 13 protein [Nocardioides sp. Kera G14]|uniref:glycoside hydrolase family 13 protein n=1 Tax=Nocardioides sp. Kera G14 TaxID=2884264 RepID=UPI001D10BFC7|nr:glycoside hydrolase family 13 protein [Nocardioides sp. Kera G14]UDY23993.1 glycoside hydrolase family 13 protein [Nocardioides sp. Kera G14]
MSTPWWRDAVVYQIYPRSFADSDGDGMGDLSGITSRLSHLVDLGVDALWLSPFFRSPQKDGGYDVADYCDVDPLFGTLADCDALMARAHELGLKVIVDLVPNHTSDEHAWFRAALASAPGSPERARYIFREPDAAAPGVPPNNWLSVFGGSAWAKHPDDPHGEWYFHLFDASQPDLDWRNPEVADMFDDVLRFWLERGVDGFRVDVAHGLFKADGMPDQVMSDGGELTSEPSDMVRRGLTEAPMWDQPEVHEVYRRWRKILESYTAESGVERMMVAEAMPLTAAGMARYVRADEFQQAFNFAFQWADWGAPQFRRVISETMEALRTIGSPPTWVLDNHDQPRHVTRYGGGPLGLARARAATLLMLALPGSAYLYQGEELGLPEAEVAPEFRQDPRTDRVGRDGCRVPIPWSGSASPYGFGPEGSTPWLPQPEDWAPLTVEAESGVEGSTLELYRSALAARRSLSGDDVELLDAPYEVVAVRRGEVEIWLNAGAEPVPLPEGSVILSSEPLADVLPPDACAWLRVQSRASL